MVSVLNGLTGHRRIMLTSNSMLLYHCLVVRVFAVGLKILGMRSRGI